MFDHLTERLGRAINSLRGRGRISAENVAETLREVRMALLEADVALPVVKRFTEAVQTRALGAEVASSLSPGQAFIAILHREMVTLLGSERSGLALNAPPPLVILLAGLQGAGKTTTAGKLARYLIQKQRKQVMLVSCDVRRPAAILQLERLATQVKAQFYPSAEGADPIRIATAALEQARRSAIDVLLVDTAGRLHIDEPLMAELRSINQAVNPHQRLLIVDAMAGQDALQAAAAFGEALPLSGIILTKADGDARGGVALSVREVTGAPIIFVGVGEKSEALEDFDPERMANRILGMGDVVALVEDVQRNIDAGEAERLARKVKQGKSFDLTDLRSQLEQVRKLGGLGALMDKLPTQMSQRALPADQADSQVKRQVAMIDSMTPRERRNPDLIDGSRRRRIAAGSGVQVQDVNRLLKQFKDMQRVMKQMKGGKLGQLLSGLGSGRGGPRPGR
jgi:signal recognition particle subunit SRP54